MSVKPTVVTGSSQFFGAAAPARDRGLARNAPLADEGSNGKTRVVGSNSFKPAPASLNSLGFESDAAEIAEHVDFVCRTLVGSDGHAPAVPVYRNDPMTVNMVMAKFLDAADPLAAFREGITAVDAKAEVRELSSAEFGQEYTGLPRAIYAAVKTRAPSGDGDVEVHVAITDQGVFPRLTEVGQLAALGLRAKKQ